MRKTNCFTQFFAKCFKDISAKKVLLSILAAAVLPLTVAVFGPFEIFVNNKQEFSFLLWDFYAVCLLFALIAFAVLTVILLLLRGKALLVGFSLITWLSVMVFLQANFLNFGMNSLMSDGLEKQPSVWLGILDLFIWLAVGAGLVFVCLKMKDKRLYTELATIALVTILGVQLINMGVSAITDAVNGEGMEMVDPEDDSYKSVNAILTDDGMFEVSRRGNIIVIVLDRFDVYYYDQLVKEDPRFFAPLDGFTYYNNNISLYSRTYPSITYMLTGMEQDFEMDAATYFERAYRGNSFFADLKRNGYSINLYTEAYYAYRNANVLHGIADNVRSYADYRISNVTGLAGKMLALSAYRYVPTLFKSLVRVSSGDFAKFIEYNGELIRYVTDDAATYAKFAEQGLTVTKDKNKTFSFIHLNGCHDPFTIDENGNRVEEGKALPAIRGVFKMIYEYFDALKREGLYEDATIIITGDHARAISDRRDVEGARVTALFVKPSGNAGTPLSYSSAPVCQENLRAQIVKSAGIVTETDYGPAFSDIGENADIARKYCFERSLEDGTHQIVEYRVVGDANDFSNWEIVDRRDIGKLYK